MNDVTSHFEGDQLWKQLKAGPSASAAGGEDSLSPSELQHLRRLFEGRPIERCARFKGKGTREGGETSERDGARDRAGYDAGQASGQALGHAAGRATVRATGHAASGVRRGSASDPSFRQLTHPLTHPFSCDHVGGECSLDPSLARTLKALQPAEPALAHLRRHFAHLAREVRDGEQYNLLLLNPFHADAMLHFVYEPSVPATAAATAMPTATAAAAAPVRTLIAFAVRREPATRRAPHEVEALEMCERHFLHDVVLVLSHWMWTEAL